MSNFVYENDPRSVFMTETAELHHYTSLQGLRGIWESQSLWATHFRGLNDSMEGSALRALLQAPLSSWLSKNLPLTQYRAVRPHLLLDPSGQPSLYTKQVARDLINDCYRRILLTEISDVGPAYLTLTNPFISCFCNHSKDSAYERENGLLSQWRGYAANGGFCIVFDTAKLIDLFLKEYEVNNIVFSSVVNVTYSDDDEAIDSLLDDLLPLFEEMLHLRKPTKFGPKSFMKSPFAKFATATTGIKHRGFKEEREVRLVVTPITKAHLTLASRTGFDKRLPLKTIQTREVRGKKVSYIALFDNLRARLPIHRIIVGPSKDQRKSHIAAARILDGNVQITLSETPFI